MKIVGSLLYLAISTRPDILHAVHYLTQQLKSPNHLHLRCIYRVLRYLSGTVNYFLQFNYGNDINLQAFADAAYANNQDRKSQHGICFRLGSSNACFYSISKKQSLIALSSTESEYIALSECVREVLWFRSFMCELGHSQRGPTSIFQDNLSCIKIAQDPSVSDRTKHIDIKHHFIRERIEMEQVKLVYVPTTHMLADILTKPLHISQFRPLVSELIGEGDFQKNFSV
jgi:hypothetical protein